METTATTNRNGADTMTTNENKDQQNVTAENVDSVTGQQLTEKQAKALRGLRAAHESVAWTSMEGVWASVYLDNVD